MNGAYLHLAVNHLPIILTPVGFLLLLAALIRKSKDLAQAGFVVLVLVALSTWVTTETGDMAAGVVRNLPGIERARIHEHAQAADYAVWPAMILGALSLFGLWKAEKSGGVPRGLAILVLLGSLFLSTIMVRVAHLGGLIRHPEIAKNFVVPPSPE